MGETAIYFDNNDNYGTWFSNHAPGIHKIKAALEKFPNEVILVSDDTDKPEGGIIVHVPKKWCPNPKPPRTVNMSDEERAIRAERMKKARDAKNESK